MKLWISSLAAGVVAGAFFMLPATANARVLQVPLAITGADQSMGVTQVHSRQYRQRSHNYRYRNPYYYGYRNSHRYRHRGYGYYGRGNGGYGRHRGYGYYGRGNGGHGGRRGYGGYGGRVEGFH